MKSLNADLLSKKGKLEEDLKRDALEKKRLKDEVPSTAADLLKSLQEKIKELKKEKDNYTSSALYKIVSMEFLNTW